MLMPTTGQIAQSQFRQQTDRQGVQQAARTAQQAAAQGKNPEDLRKACQDFEALFIKQMLDAMRKTVPDNPLVDGGQGEDIFEDMLYDEYSQKMADTAGLGLADMMYSQLKPGQGGLTGIAGE